MNELSLRLAATADLPTILKLDQEIFGGYGGDEDPEVIAARLTVFPAGCAVMETADRLIVGYLTTEKWEAVRDPALNEPPAETHRPDGTVLNITTLAIVPDWQNRNLGGLLLSYAEQIAIAEGCQDVVLETAHARRFYEKHGYQCIGERHQNGVHLFVMLRRLV